MLRSDPRSMKFDQLMAQAARIAKEQDAAREEKEQQKRREEEKKKRREEREIAERKRVYEERALERDRLDRKRQRLLEQKKIQRERERLLPSGSKAKPRSSSNPEKRAQLTAPKLPEKKKAAHMSYSELMNKAKAKETAQKTKPLPSSTPFHPSTGLKTLPKQAPTNRTPSVSPSDTKRASGLFIKRRSTASSRPSDTLPGSSQVPARERLRAMYKEPLQKVTPQQRDRRSVSEIQRDLRHSKGIYSDDEDTLKKTDPRLLHNRINAKRMQAESHRSLSPRHTPSYREPTTGNPVRRPMYGRPTNPSRRPMKHRYYSDEEEEEEDDLRSFIVSDEDEPDEIDHSNEIARMFRYDKNRYTNETYSDDDMEANASDLLREEKRSAQIARREDLEEERLEMERLKRKKLKGKNKA